MSEPVAPLADTPADLPANGPASGPAASAATGASGAPSEATAPGEQVILSARSLERTYRMGHEVVNVLRGADLDLRAGESVAIMGRSGAGKSTLLHLMGLLDHADSGSLALDGIETTGLSAAGRARLRNRLVGFVFQFYHLLPELSALENAMLPRMIAHGPMAWMGQRGKARRDALALLDELGLKERARHRPGQLSGGERQRVAIARALVTGPRLLLCDEPTGNLDEHTSDIIAEQLFDISRRHGHTLVLVTHDDDLAVRADRRLRLHDGHLEPV
ncbi:MAG: ABC transporter ATP-binding protein [Planctomycetota bacterium]|jgi:lipoprotein-releasing system ATP-binding protein